VGTLSFPSRLSFDGGGDRGKDFNTMANLRADDGALMEPVERERRALSPEAEPTRGLEHDRMSIFAGRWQAEGQSHEPEGRMIADETWEWLPGGFFLTCRFFAHIGELEHKGIGYLAWDGARGVHTCRLIDNLGYDRLYDLSANGRVWTFRGERERATYDFAEDGQSIDIRWEVRGEARDWRPLCDLKATRTGGLGPTAH
jgi:hypothetical protein